MRIDNSKYNQNDYITIVHARNWYLNGRNNFYKNLRCRITPRCVFTYTSNEFTNFFFDNQQNIKFSVHILLMCLEILCIIMLHV